MNRRKKGQLHGLVTENVEMGASLYSDDLRSYDGLGEDFEHQVVNHAIQYVDGQVHTNGLENFWTARYQLEAAVGSETPS